MGLEPVIGFGDQLPVETLLTSTGFVATAKDDSVPLRIEGECEALDTIRRLQPQFLHVLVT